MKKNMVPSKKIVSVIMPAYNAEKYISEAMESVLSQTYPHLELIIINDASTDNTKNVVKKSIDERVIFLSNDENKGIAESTNRAIAVAKGEYICFLDDDDVTSRNRIEIQVEYLEKHPEIDVLGGSYCDIDAQGIRKSLNAVNKSNPKYIKAMLLFGIMPFSNGTIMCRKKVFIDKKISIQNGMHGMQDLQFLVDASKVVNLSTVPYILYCHRKHDMNETLRQMNQFADLRHNKYSEIIIDSLSKSGFVLSNTDKEKIYELFWEGNNHYYTREQIIQKKELLYSIILQAKEKQMDCIDEIEFVCKKIISDNVYRMKDFWE